MAIGRAQFAVVGITLLAAAAVAADPEPPLPPGPTPEPQTVEWQFSYQGPRVVAKGVVSTAAVPEPDGNYLILSITGKRNGKRIVELVPAGEFVTAHTFLYSDNRLFPASPFVGEAGFSYRTSDDKYFNVCHAGEDGTCGSKGYLEYDGKRGRRPIRLVLKRLQTQTPVTTPPAPDSRHASDAG